MAQSDPKEAVERVQERSGALALEDGDLMSERQDFEGGGASTADEDAHHGQQGKDELKHDSPL